jgi:hypothetical protein
VQRALVTILLLLLAAAAPAAAAEPMLPDLFQETPYNLGVEQYNSPAGPVYHLGFGSTVYNFGRGPLKIEATRASTADPQMSAAQVVENSSGAETRYPNIGRMQYVDSITHRHWHYVKFDTYELRAANGKLVAPDQKTGFCLGDRVVGHDFETLAGQPTHPVFNGGCGYDEPDLLTVTEGISVNYADPYEAQVEGQFVDLTGVPAGRYQLIHHVNADRALREVDYSNDVASVLVDVSWPAGPSGAPVVSQLMRCDLSAKCPVAPALTKAQAAGYARTALRTAYKARSARVSCAQPKRGKAVCTGTWSGGRGKVTVAYAVSSGRLYWTYAASAPGKKAARGRVEVVLKPTPVPYTPVAAGKGKLAYCPLIARG